KNLDEVNNMLLKQIENCKAYRETLLERINLAPYDAQNKNDRLLHNKLSVVVGLLEIMENKEEGSITKMSKAAKYLNGLEDGFDHRNRAACLREDRDNMGRKISENIVSFFSKFLNKVDSYYKSNDLFFGKKQHELEKTIEQDIKNF